MKTVPHNYDGNLGDIADLLAVVEENYHIAGWDNTPPTLYRVGREAGRLQLDPVRLTKIVDAHPREALRLFARGLEHPSGAILESGFTAPPIAHLLVMEAWMRSYASAAERESETRRFADIPGSIEARWAVAVAGQYMLYLSRQRGSAPEFLQDCKEVSGGMYESLCDIHRATLKLWQAKP